MKFNAAIAIAAVILASQPQLAAAQIMVGNPRVIDGDTLDFSGTRVRLFGIDAPEAAQPCNRAGEEWACGQEAKTALQDIIGGRQVNCQQRDLDQYGRVVATCLVGRLDLADALATAGLAIALPQFSTDYVTQAERAQRLRVGIWGGEFVIPAEYRANDPHFLQLEQSWLAEQRRERAAARVSDTPAQQGISNDVYYRGCREVRAAGAAPLNRGQPGYRPEMDGDGDGVACEPPRR